MKKDDFWLLSLITFFIIGCALHWTLWIRITVIANAVIVLIGLVTRLYKSSQKDKKE